jgi:hypothetical protein
VARCQEHECEEALVSSGEHKQHPGELWVERQAQRRAHVFIFYRRAASFSAVIYFSIVIFIVQFVVCGGRGGSEADLDSVEAYSPASLPQHTVFLSQKYGAKTTLGTML